MADVFLSYNREDQAKAKLIAKALESDGFDVWWDTVLRAGQTYDEVTEKQLRDANAVVVLWSSRSVRSKWVRAEATLGDRKSALIPVMIEQCDRPIMFELIQTADLTAWDGDVTDANWLAFVADVREHVERKRGVAAAKAAADALAQSEPAASVAPKPAEGADTIEAAFWMSVQDGEDPSEFEAYLDRYPDGHFAKLAKKRLKVLAEEAVAAAPPPPTPPPPEPPPPPAVQTAPPTPLPSTLQTPRTEPPRPRTVAAAPLPPPPPAARMSEPSPRRKSGGFNPLIIGAGVVAVLVAAIVFWPRAPEAPPPVEVASVPTPASVEPAPTAPPATPAETEQATFRDCPECPEMARLARGSFTMGSPASEPGRRAWEGPQRDVQIAAFAIGVREVSFAEWDACVADGGCARYAPPDRGWGRGARPVLMVSWNDAQTYVRWLNGKSDRTYRLPTEAEWEFAARGGAETAFWWGDRYDASQVSLGRTSDAGAHTANAFGLFDVTGNVAEWVEDCYVNGFTGAPSDGRAVLQGNCGQRVVRGGSWRDNAQGLRLANRSRIARATRDGGIGFRVAASN